MDYNMRITHFTLVNFTLEEERFGPQVYKEVLWIQAVTALLSILGSASIIGYAVFHNLVKLPEVRPLFYLNLSDLLLALCWLIGVILYRQAKHSALCFNLQAVGQMFYLSTFYYTLNYAWQTYSNMKRRLNNNSNKISNTACFLGKVAIILSSMLPFLFTVPVWYIGNKKECYMNSNHSSCLVLNIGAQVTTDPSVYTSNECKILYYYKTALFLATFFITALSTLVISGYSYISFRKDMMTAQSLYYNQWAMITTTRRTLLLFLVIFLFCCLPVVTLAFLKLTNIMETEEYTIFYYIQALAAVSQGFLNCLAYGWTQHILRCLKQSDCHDVNTQTPLLRSQKKIYASMQTSDSSIPPLTATLHKPTVSAL